MLLHPIARRTNHRSSVGTGAIVLLLAACALPAAGQDADLESLTWQHGPGTAAMASLAKIDLPEGYMFCGADDTRKLMEWMENPVSGAEMGLVAPDDFSWFFVCEWDECGYIRDDDKDALDADAMLRSVREGSERSNRERRKRGWAPLRIVGWEQPPRYDEQTQNLVWAIRAECEGEFVVNYNTRRLGREGSMAVTLVCDPEQLDEVVPAFNKVMAGYGFQAGKRYADFREGDKVAQYGLAALITGGAAAVALKTGLLQKLWKVIVVGVLALVGGIKALFGRRKTHEA